MKIQSKFVTKNRCYKQNRRIKITAITLHSVGCAQPSADVFQRVFNNPNLSKCVHAFVDGLKVGKVVKCTPWNLRNWHCGGKANGYAIGIEMCESNQIKYLPGGKVKIADKAKAQKHCRNAYVTAVALCAKLCKDNKLNPLKDIFSHKEGHAMGVASNHGDPEYYWKILGMPYTMDGFREDVKKKIDSSKAKDKPNKEKSKAKPKKVDSKNLYRVQVGAFSVKENADKLQADLKKKGYDAIIV